MAEKVQREQRDIDRDEELARQEVVRKAVEKHELAARKEAEEALRRQGVYETTGIRTVEGKP